MGWFWFWWAASQLVLSSTFREGEMFLQTFEISRGPRLVPSLLIFILAAVDLVLVAFAWVCPQLSLLVDYRASESLNIFNKQLLTSLHIMCLLINLFYIFTLSAPFQLARSLILKFLYESVNCKIDNISLRLRFSDDSRNTPTYHLLWFKQECMGPVPCHLCGLQA